MTGPGAHERHPEKAARARTLISLYGPSGAGKTTTGRALANELNLPFVDLDEEIEARAGMPIPEIFAVQGEPRFRELERTTLQEVLSTGQGVLALGGGALIDPASRAQVERAGPVLCLKAPLETLLARLRSEGDQRPLLAGKPAARLQALLARRADHYASFPIQLDTTNLSTERAAREAQVLLGAFFVRGMGPGYDVRVRSGLLDHLGSGLHERGLRGPIGLVSDENVALFYAPRARQSIQGQGLDVHTVVIPAGEEHKTLKTISRLWEALLQARLERGSTVVALGGGVVGDLAGFAAATYLRGVPWVVVPTTLLAMVDASLGGKTSANLPQGKNLAGAFHPPRLVLADPATLDSLPESELRAGMAEVIMHAIIDGPVLFDLCSKGWPAVRANRDEIVRRSMAVKIRIIQEDPFEQGRRAALNLGHTIGHALEVASGYRLRHGEAVAMGLVAEARLAEGLGLAEKGLADTIAGALRALGLPTEVPSGLDREAIIKGMEVDKKRARGEVLFSLPARVGEVQVGVSVDDKIVAKSLAFT